MVYGTGPTQLMSPACGCARDEAENWRGITFLTDRFEIEASRPSNSPAIAYTVFAPFPGPFAYVPLQFRLNVTEYDVTIPTGAPLEIAVARDGPPLVPRGHVTVSQRGTPHIYSFVTDGPLTLQTTGELPIGAWIPLRNSRIRLSSHTSARDRSETGYMISEAYPADPHPSRDTAIQSDNLDGGYPTVDFIGPVVWGWARQDEEGRLQHYVVTRIEAPYAVRTVIEPLFGEGEHQLFAPRTVGGEAHLSFVKTGSDILRYRQLSERIASHPMDITTAQDLSFTDGNGVVTNGSSIMVMMSPPAPVGDGFNLFGAIQALRMENTSGALMIGANSWAMRNAQLSLFDLQGFTRDGMGSSLPVQMEGDDVRVDAEFSATGRATLNGETLTTRLRSLDGFLQGINVVALFLALAGAIIPFFLWLKRKFGGASATTGA